MNDSRQPAATPLENRYTPFLRNISSIEKSNTHCWPQTTFVDLDVFPKALPDCCHGLLWLLQHLLPPCQPVHSYCGHDRKPHHHPPQWNNRLCKTTLNLMESRVVLYSSVQYSRIKSLRGAPKSRAHSSVPSSTDTSQLNCLEVGWPQEWVRANSTGSGFSLRLS